MRFGVCLLAAALAGGCASHRAARSAEPTLALEAMIEKVRQLSVAARPPRPDEAVSFEKSDARLTAARALLTIAPTGAHHRAVAEEYVRLGILDVAYDHFAAAVRIDPRDAAALDGRARVWRDWGYAHLALTDAYRAIYYAPDSAAAQNTLGTLLLELGLPSDARTAFERAVTLDPAAAYALNNVCYAAVLQGDQAGAIGACRKALAMNPEFRSARNNLGLAYAAAGNWQAASGEFSRSTADATSRFNMGVALMATRHYAEAALAFDEAAALGRPLARQRAEQARKHAAVTPGS